MSNPPAADSDRSRRLARRPVQTGKPGSVTAPPETLSPAGCRYWHEYVPSLDARGVFESADSTWLANLCEDLAEMDVLRAALAEVKVGSLEYARLSVALDRAAKRALAISREHSLSPAGRLRAGVVKTGGATLLGILDAEDD